MSAQLNSQGYPMPKPKKAKSTFTNRQVPLDNLEQYKGSNGAQSQKSINRSSSRGSKDKWNTPGVKAPTDKNPFDAMASDLMKASKKVDAKWTKQQSGADQEEVDLKDLDAPTAKKVVRVAKKGMNGSK